MDESSSTSQEEYLILWENAKSAFSASERSKGEGKEEEGKGEQEIGSETLAETGKKIANAPAGNRTRDPSTVIFHMADFPLKKAEISLFQRHNI